MFKPYVTIISNKPDPIIHLANSHDTTYCQFENTTHRKLEGHHEKPCGRLCINCLTVQNGGIRPSVKIAQRSQVSQRPLFEFDRRKLPQRTDIDMMNPAPPWD